MNYLTWDEIHVKDVIYDTVNKECITIHLKSYNVYCQKMFVGKSENCDTITTRVFDEKRYTRC